MGTHRLEREVEEVAKKRKEICHNSGGLHMAGNKMRYKGTGSSADKWQLSEAQGENVVTAIHKSKKL